VPDGDESRHLDVFGDAQQVLDLPFVAEVQGRQHGTEPETVRCQQDVLHGRVNGRIGSRIGSHLIDRAPGRVDDHTEPPTDRLSEKGALVTGGNTAIARAICLALRQRTVLEPA
jgi:hypothetical protein